MEILKDSMIKLKNEAALRQAGLSAEESLRITFGDEVSRKTFDDLATIKMKEELEKLNIKS